MKWSFMNLCLATCALSLVACGKDAQQSASPTAASATTSAADTPRSATIKASAPVPTSPPNGQKVDTQGSTDVVLTVKNAVATNNVGMPVGYRFQVFTSGGALVEEASVDAGSGQTSYVIKAQLEGDQTYTWWARAETTGAAQTTEWSSRWSFIAPQLAGFLNSDGLYDPLINGQTVGKIVGPTLWHPGLGIELLSLDSYVQYDLPRTISQGEFSYLASNVRTGSEGGKTKLLAMQQGYDDITTNDRRLTFEKRGDGTVAWRLITYDDQIDTIGPERIGMDFRPTSRDHTWFFEVSWRNNQFIPIIREHSATGPVRYRFQKSWKGREYDPTPHVAYLGGPSGRAGSDSGSVPNIIIRQVWLSDKPRPESIAN